MYLQEISQNQGKLLGFINSLHFNNEEAQDILQDTNVTLINKQEDFDESRQFLPWAFAVARFTWLAHKKKKAIELKNCFYDTHITNVLLDKKSASLKEEICYDIEAERLRLLGLVREKLTNKQQALLDALLEGKSLQDIAEECGARYGTIQTLKVRTIRKVKDIILKIKYQEKLHENASIEKAKKKIQEAQGGHFESAQGRA